MESRLTRFLYDYSPPFVQDLCASGFGYEKVIARFWRDYDRWFAFYSAARKWSLAELLEYQREQLVKTARNAYENTAFYRERFRKAGLTPDDIRGVADLGKLPLLEKEEIRLHSQEMISHKYRRSDYEAHPTGGTTGMALMIYTPKQVIPRHYAFLWSRARTPVRFGDPYASFTGLQIVRPERDRPPFWRRNCAARQTCYSVFHLRPEFMDSYLDDLNRRRFVWWEGYPGAMVVLAEYLEQSGRPFWNYPRHVISTSEQLLPTYRETLSRALKTRVWEEYGQGEMAGRITEYPCGHLHYDLDYSVMEFLPAGVEDGEEVYELACTGFVNDGWPMIRYRVGDLVVLDQQSTCDYYAGPIIKTIHGRTGHMIRTPDGHRISNISVIAKKCRHVRGLQIIQEELDSVIINVVKAPEFVAEDESFLLDQFRLKWGNKLGYRIRYVGELEHTRLGKTLSIISRLRTPQTPPIQAPARELAGSH